jgi:DnaJ-class molecular chaperone
VSIFDLMLGSSIEISTPANRHFSLTIPKGTKPGTVFSISGQGVPNVNTRRPGNAHIKIEATVPKIKDEALLQKLKEIKDEINKLS